jgi:hypothetical protein
MKNGELEIQHKKIQNLFKETTNATGGDMELQAHWAKYLCILSAGFLENAICEVYIDFVKSKAPQPIAQYTSSVLRKIQNPRASKFEEVAKSFKESWGNDLKDFLQENGRKDAIDSIMQNRHLIAHGKNSGITVVRIKEWFEKSVEVVIFIENQCAK